MNEPPENENLPQQPLASDSKLIPISGGIIGYCFVGPWTTLFIGILLLFIQGLIWSLKNPEELWDKIDCHIQRARSTKDTLNLSHPKKRELPKSSQW